MKRPDWLPDDVDIHRPSIARVYDYYLGGSHNFASDRQAAREALALTEEGRQAVYANRDFLRRAVRCCVEQGVTQFLDVGSGIPTVGNVHAVAQEIDPDARVVYVDVDPVAVAHSRAILAGDPNTAVVQADVRQPERILGDSLVGRLLDLNQPVALLMVAVLHFVSDEDDPHGIVRRFRDRLAPGSLLVISHGSEDDIETDTVYAGFNAAYDKLVAPLSLRSKREVVALFDGFELVDPGVEWVTRWRPDEGADTSATLHVYGGVGRKPGSVPPAQ